MNWWEELILTNYQTYGLADKYDAAGQCLDEIRMGKWRVLTYPRERGVVIVGDTNVPGVGTVHIWADGGNLLRFGRLFMHDIWEQMPYLCLVGAIMDRRVERFAKWLGFTYFCSGALGERYWTITRKAS